MQDTSHTPQQSASTTHDNWNIRWVVPGHNGHMFYIDPPWFRKYCNHHPSYTFTPPSVQHSYLYMFCWALHTHFPQTNTCLMPVKRQHCDTHHHHIGKTTVSCLFLRTHIISWSFWSKLYIMFPCINRTPATHSPSSQRSRPPATTRFLSLQRKQSEWLARRLMLWRWAQKLDAGKPNSSHQIITYTGGKPSPLYPWPEENMYMFMFSRCSCNQSPDHVKIAHLNITQQPDL